MKGNADQGNIAERDNEQDKLRTAGLQDKLSSAMTN